MALILYYGTECIHCHAMFPSIDKLEKETKLKIKKVEVWHNAKNAAEFQKRDAGKCGGVPFFFNTATKKWICGSTDYETFKKWALGK